ncbi:MAG: ComF family protein [Armatimonadetes bacterium]|nr:ComF family protein [Armatimonadota bacterium]
MRCALCDQIGAPAICNECRNDFHPPKKLTINEHLGSVDSAKAIYDFNGNAAEAVRKLKYNRVTSLGEPMADLLFQHIQSEINAWDVVLPVPISRKRRNERGFNQSELLCEGFPKEMVRFDLLHRHRHTRPQVGLSAADRMTNLSGAFQASNEVKGKRILLIDDVTTTGGTAIACAEALKSAGACRVDLLTFCGG